MQKPVERVTLLLFAGQFTKELCGHYFRYRSQSEFSNWGKLGIGQRQSLGALRSYTHPEITNSAYRGSTSLSAPSIRSSSSRITRMDCWLREACGCGEMASSAARI